MKMKDEEQSGHAGEWSETISMFTPLKLLSEKNVILKLLE